MKRSIIFTFCFLSLTFLMGQSAENDRSGRNGQWILEVGNGFFTNTGGANTGSSIIFSDGSTQTSIGLNAGKFISDDLAIKANISILSFGSDFGGSLNTFMAGGKYYIGGSLPLELTGGVVTGQGISQSIFRATIGYAIPLADNINFEPAVGLLYADEGAGLFQLGFAMFF